MHTLLKNLMTLVLSLILATLVWIAAVREQNPPREDDYSRSIPVEVKIPAPGLTTTDALPDTVRVRLLAPQSSWQNLTPSKFKASLDLSNLPPGLNDVTIDIDVSDPEVEIVRVTPQDVTVNIQVEQTITIPVTVEVTDSPPLGYINRAPIVLPSAITVTGASALIAQVDEAVSDTFVGNSKETIERMRDVIIRDQNDQVIDGLKVTPTKVQITLPIEQRFGYKDVAVSAVVQGQAAPGYWVSNISVNPPRLVIVGNPSVLNKIPGFIETIPINVNNVTESITRIVPLNLPDGVTIVLPGGETTGASGVQVIVDIATIESGQTVQRPIVQQGIDPAYTWTASPERADVILSGAIPVLQSLDFDDVSVIVDLFGLEPGVYQVKPTIFFPDNLRVEAILPDTIEVTISRIPTATPTPLLTRTPQLTATATGLGTRTLTVEKTATTILRTATPQAREDN